MSKFSAFMKGNVEEVENAPLPLPRFGEDIILRAVPSEEADKINESCFVNKVGMKGKQERVFDGVKYNRRLSIAAIIHPDLNDVELQDSYGVRGVDALFGKMFLVGEAVKILEKVSELSGIGQDINDDIEEAKN